MVNCPNFDLNLGPISFLDVLHFNMKELNEKNKGIKYNKLFFIFYNYFYKIIFLILNNLKSLE